MNLSPMEDAMPVSELEEATLEMLDVEVEDLEEIEPSEATAITGREAELDELMVATFSANPLPALVMDDNLEFILVNEACRAVFSDFYSFDTPRFSDIFGHALGLDQLRELRNAMRSQEKGYSWKGIVKSKKREAGTLLTKAYLFPIFPKKVPQSHPKAYVLLFDDVTDENRVLLRNVFLSLLEASKLKDNDTGMHIRRVNLYAQLIAQTLFDQPGYEVIDRDFIDDIAFLAAMHDVGKIGTPDDILNKEGPLSDWEWSIMKEHTKNGAYILSTYPNPMAREIALYHHEKWDGSGYPYNLERKMIPLAARIVAIGDVYDALRMKRSYKPAFSHEVAIGKIKEGRGSHFDPSLIDIVLKIEAKFDTIFEENAD